MTTFDYTSRDYYSIREDLLSRAAELPIGTEWTTQSTSDFGVMMVELWAYMGDVLHYYVDRAAAEAYIGTATQRDSVLALANLLDYEQLHQQSSTASVTLERINGYTSDIVIPYGTGFVAPARSTEETTVYFVTTNSASMAASNTSVTLTVVEGQLELEESPVNVVSSNANKSNGSPNQKFNLRYTGVVPSSVSVNVYEGPIVNGSPTAVAYRYVPRFVDTLSYDKVFTVSVSADNIAQIVFGNGLNGKIPAKDAAVTVTYRRSNGAAGNISEDRITSFSTAAPSGVIISNSTAATGGFDNESIESLKSNVPMLFRTQDRAVSLQDFKDLSLRIPGVVKATASNSGAHVTIYPVTYQPDYLSTSFGSTITVSSDTQTETLSYFEPRTMLGASVSVASTISLTGVYITADIYCFDGYVQKKVKDDVIASLDELLSFDNVYFGQVLSLGEIYRAIIATEGVDYANITVFNTSASGIASNNKITASSTQLLRKATDYTLNMNGGVSG